MAPVHVLILGAWLLAGLLSAAADDASAFRPIPLANPGFEDGAAPWALDNWSGNVASAERDPENPHSGKWSMRVRLDRVVGISDIMLALPGVGVRSGEAVELRFWARGVSNGAAITVMLRQGGGARKTFYRKEVILTDEWQEYVCRTLLPGGVDPSDATLRFRLQAPGVFWVDDVSLAELPPVEGGAPQAANPVRNPSFEAGIDGWTATLRLREFGTLQDETGGNSPAPPDARLDVRVDDRGDKGDKGDKAPQGRRYLSVLVPELGRAFLTSAYFPARYGHKLRLAFRLRSDGVHPFKAGIGADKNARTSFDFTPEKSSGEWRGYSIPITLKPSNGEVYFVRFHFDEPGRYDLDAVSLIEEEAAAPVLYPPAVAVQPSGDAPVANLYSQGDTAKFRVVAAAEKPGGRLACRVAVFDYRERKVADLPVEVAADAGGYGESGFDVPTGKFGAFRIEARRADSGELLAEQLYSVLPPLPPPAERPDSYFGGHVDLTPYGLEVARRAGIRWLRIYAEQNPSLWMAVEPEPGKWDFRTRLVEAAHAQGFRVLGSLNTAPDFAADRPPDATGRTRWAASWPPADLAAWKEYVSRCVTAFGPSVDAWEVWNEPDGYYMQVRPGQKKEDVYGRLLRAAREAVDALGVKTTLLGPGVTNVNAPMGWAVLKDGGNAFLDAFSFHFYSLAAGGGNPDDAFVVPLLAKYRAYSNRAGEPMPLWDTESGIYLSGSQSWLATYRVPPSSAVTPPQGAAAMARTALLFKALGVKRHFVFQAGANAAGRQVNEDITCGFIDVTGVPGPGIAAHAAMVALTEDAAPAGFDVRQAGAARVKAAHFRAADRTVDVYWSDADIALGDAVPPRPGDEIRDMMGNPVPFAEARLGEYPLYVLGGRGKTP